MADTILVRPRTGLILDGIPRQGAEIPRALAEEWIGNRLVVPVTTASKPDDRPSTKSAGTTRRSS